MSYMISALPLSREKQQPLSAAPVVENQRLLILCLAFMMSARVLSGGQKQRLSIARALVKRAEIYIFDDSFSALDFKTDAKLRTELNKMIRETQATVLLVAQRISSIMHADRIVVLDKGRVAGIGTHEELMESCEVYQEIAYSQLSKEELGNE